MSSLAQASSSRDGGGGRAEDLASGDIESVESLWDVQGEAAREELAEFWRTNTAPGSGIHVPPDDEEEAKEGEAKEEEEEEARLGEGDEEHANIDENQMFPKVGFGMHS